MVVIVAWVQVYCAGWWLGGVGEFQPNMALDRSPLRGLRNGFFECRPLVGMLVVAACGELCDCERVP